MWVSSTKGEYLFGVSLVFGASSWDHLDLKWMGYLTQFLYSSVFPVCFETVLLCSPRLALNSGSSLVLVLQVCNTMPSFTLLCVLCTLFYSDI
jgi:hypothetical protein